ncbi:hypothetical protein INR49_006391 [Caranx melampygus]|nr:hypothetical protein INR49_006391 [Caranx melampygus]
MKKPELKYEISYGHVLCRQMTLGHEFGAGAACLKCKDKCEGFELHFWRNTVNSRHQDSNH